MIKRNDERMIRRRQDFLDPLSTPLFHGKEGENQRTCSARARLILFRLIISLFERTVSHPINTRSRQESVVRNGTFHSEQPFRLLLPYEVYLSDISLSQQLDLRKRRRSDLDTPDLYRVRAIRPSETRSRAALRRSRYGKQTTGRARWFEVGSRWGRREGVMRVVIGDGVIAKARGRFAR